MCELSIIIPVFNEELILPNSISVIKKEVEKVTNSFEIILINDGSTDRTFETIKELNSKYSLVKGLSFTRNFGKEAAINAGLMHAKGSAAILMDADLQHPPEIIGEFYKKWKDENYHIVEAVKIDRGEENIFGKLRAKYFNYLVNKLSGINLKDSSDYKLLDRKVVDQINSFYEKNRFFRGIVAWTGYRTYKVGISIDKRSGGQSKFSIYSLIKLSMTAITSFSNIPLYIVTYLGFFTLLSSFVIGLQTLYNKFSGVAVSGFTTVIILQLILSSIIMISLGIIGEYISRIYTEVKNRPVFIVSETVGN